MTKQPTKLDGVLRQFEIWIGLMKLGATNSSAAEHALNRTQAKQAIYDLINSIVPKKRKGMTDVSYQKGHNQAIDTIKDNIKELL